ncbi:MAG: UDP-N-acetylmuramoyl-L-alanyl-D-glutamate--2,6-diaminopimelate ligase [Planctomycetota bacterium]|nr:UDP-N-acetylmuramoyl-L-alanyl-D-glutamate--2,6-diaminopimelate ligase [Planctomycetota bacterium]
MQLARLLEDLSPAPKFVPRLDPATEITGLSIDSRRVRQGHLFAALPGARNDGAVYAKDAWERGAAAILTERDDPLTGLPQIVVPHARAALAHLARRFHEIPDRRLKLGAVTGTNGKSTSAYLVRHLLNATRTPCGLLGTIEYDVGDPAGVLEAPLTTPEAPDVCDYLRRMAEHGCRAAIMEVSSHGLVQRRVEGLQFAAGVFTNLTQDHLDFHRTMEQYRDAKGLLFEALAPSAHAVLNLDDEAGRWYAARTHATVLGFTMENRREAELRGTIKRMDIQGTTFLVESPWGKRVLRWGLVGAHNIQNALAALGASMVLGSDMTRTFNMDAAMTALERFAGVPGRLQAVGDGIAPFRVLVDYAHTDDALRRVMQALRAVGPSRLLVVFGCGGDRDRTKRPKMGRAVDELADLGVVTSDNPRTEDPHAIIAEVGAGIRRHGKFIVEPDRARAIDQAIGEARPGDVVLIAGKGHEDYQIVGTEKRPFDDRVQAKAALERRFGTQKSI